VLLRVTGGCMCQAAGESWQVVVRAGWCEWRAVTPALTANVQDIRQVHGVLVQWGAVA
jgi:hypothetical protein